MPSPTDDHVRISAFNWLKEQTRIFGEVLPRKVLEQGFTLDNVRIPLMGPQGIWKPAILPLYPLSITSTPDSPYDDDWSPDELLLYKYRGTDPMHRDNVGLRRAMKERIPLIYFLGVFPGKYLAAWPVHIVGDNLQNLTFTVAVDDFAAITMRPGQEPTQVVNDPNATLGRRAYITVQTRKRLHQQMFRERVLAAYQVQCACCRLRHEQLLDAAHIIPDSEPEGLPVVTNEIHVRPDILGEADGPMLLHGLQGLDKKKIILPRSASHYPDQGLLDRRFERFRSAS